MSASQRWTMVAAILGSSMVFLDGSIVNVALRFIGYELPGTLVSTLEGQTYVVSGYLAVLSALLVLAGALADYYGRRRVFLLGLVGFGVTSALCGLAPSLEVLVLARILQGATGALLVPGSLAIITATFEGPERARAFGVWAAATSSTVVLGPIVGGLLVDTISWRAAFLINLPLSALALWATYRHMAETRAAGASGRFDWLGAVVAVVAVGGLSFGVIRGQDREWQDPVAWAAFAIGVVATVAFPVLMARRPNPLVPLALFRRRAFATLNASTLLIYSALYTMLTMQALFLQGVLGYTATAAGVVSLPVGMLLTVLSTRVGTLAGRLGARPFLVLGPVLMALGVLWLARIPATSEPWLLSPSDSGSFLPPVSVLVDVVPYAILFGLGISLVVAPLTSMLMSSVPVGNAGVASAINNAVSRIGQPLVIAVIFVAVTGTFYASLATQVPGLDASDPAVRELIQPLNEPKAGTPVEVAAAATVASTGAFHVATIVAGVLLLAGAVVNAVGLRGGQEEDAAGAGAAGAGEAGRDAPSVGVG